MNRREFLQTAGALAVVANAAPLFPLSAAELPAATALGAAEAPTSVRADWVLLAAPIS